MMREPMPGRHANTESAEDVPYAREPAPGEVQPPLPAEPLTPASPTRPPVPAEPRTGTGKGQHAVRRSRFGGLWVGLIVAAVILVVLLVFILQNSQSVRIDFFGLSGHAPLAVAILLGGAAGALLVAIPGSVRILQLRRAVKHDHRP
jgi:uncharacterized integral membrane protein